MMINGSWTITAKSSVESGQFLVLLLDEGYQLRLGVFFKFLWRNLGHFLMSSATGYSASSQKTSFLIIAHHQSSHTHYQRGWQRNIAAE